MNIESQKIERKLREELEGCVTRAESDKDKKRLANLENSEAALRTEAARLRVSRQFYESNRLLAKLKVNFCRM